MLALPDHTIRQLVTTRNKGRRTNLFLSDEETDGRIRARRNAEARHSLDPNLVNNPRSEIGGIVYVGFVRDDSYSARFVGGELDRPSIPC